MLNWRKSEQKRLKRIENGKRKADGCTEEPSPKPKRRMDPRDADNFLNLAAALKILLARSIDISELSRAQKLLQTFLDGFMTVKVTRKHAGIPCTNLRLQIHPDNVKPNFHYITHIFVQIRDYGPVYGFWTFLFERLNKILKTYAVNNHGGGELEVTFFREFSRETRLRSMVCRGLLVSI